MAVGTRADPQADRRRRRGVRAALTPAFVVVAMFLAACAPVVGGAGGAVPDALAVASGSTDNLLSPDQATVETSATGWTPQGNTTVTRTTAVARSGAAALRVAVDRRGPWPDGTRTARVATSIGVAAVPVAAGTSYTGTLWVRPDEVVSPVRCELRWYRTDGSILATDSGPLRPEKAGGWVRPSCSATAPSGAAYAALRLFVDDADYGDVHFVDDASLVAADASSTVDLPTVRPDPAPTPTTTPASTPPSTIAPTPAGYPAPGSVGYRGFEAALRVIDATHPPAVGTFSDGVLTLRGDVLLDHVYVRGGVSYQGGGTLRIRDSIVEGGHGSWPIVVLGSGGTIDVADSTLRWNPSAPHPGHGQGVMQAGERVRFVVRRSDLSGMADGIQTNGAGSIIEGNWIHDLQLINGTHNDGIQVYAGDDLVIRDNRIEVGPWGHESIRNAAVFLKPMAPDLSRATIEGNYLQGGGFVLRLEGAATRDAVVRDNVFERFNPAPDGPWGYAYVIDGATVAQWSGNVTTAGDPVGRP